MSNKTRPKPWFRLQEHGYDALIGQCGQACDPQQHGQNVFLVEALGLVAVA